MEKTDFCVLLVSLFNGEALGLRQLYSVLHHTGYDAKLLFLKLDVEKTYEERQRDLFTNDIDGVSEGEVELLLKFIRDMKPKVIGISLVSSHFYLYKRLYARIRELGDFKIVVGGWQPSLNPEEVIPYCDMLCIGEGDEAFPELIERLNNNEPIDNIRNIWLNDRGIVIKNEIRPLNQNLDSLPNVVFDNESTYFIEDNQIVNLDPYMDNSRYGLIAGRGCPYHCTYCSNSHMINNIYPREWSKIRYRSVAHVMNELLEVKSKLSNVKKINFYDEVFLPNKEWAAEFFERYKEEIGLPFYCMFFPGTCREALIKVMKEGGLAGVWIGIQSGSQRVREEVYKRKYTNALIIEQAEIFRAYDISVRYDFIFDNPFESFEESLESIYLMLELPEPFSLNLFSLKYFPNTDITKMALDAGIITKIDCDDSLAYDRHNYFISKKSDHHTHAFINQLAMYISFLANKGEVQVNKNSIYQLIENYKSCASLQEIQKLLKPYLHKVL